MSESFFIEDFREALVKVGLTSKEAFKYNFHGWRHFHTSYMVKKTGKVIQQFLAIEGYNVIPSPLVCITDSNPRYVEYVHRLVALTYVPGYSKEKWICHHKDNNRRNNHPDNLKWVLKEEHKAIHGFNSFKKAA